METEVAYLTGADAPQKVRIVRFDINRLNDPELVRIITEDGQEVTHVTQFPVRDSYPIRGVLRGGIQSWTATGEYEQGLQGSQDLRMAFPVKLDRVWLLRDPLNGVANKVFYNKEEAEEYLHRYLRAGAQILEFEYEVDS